MSEPWRVAASRFDRLLALCARGSASEPQAHALRHEAERYRDWQTLPERAEAHGIAPLVHHYLTLARAEVPRDVRRTLLGNQLRHRHQSAIYSRLLGELCGTFEARGVPLLILKGAALAQLVYPDVALRAMRDIDVLVHEHDLHRAGEILGGLGYEADDERGWARSRSHPHHQPQRMRIVDDMRVRVEVHRRLGIAGRARSTLAQLAPGGMDLTVAGVSARTLSASDMLLHVHYHGFRTPLDWQDTLRLISLADLSLLVPAWLDRFDWRLIDDQSPRLRESLGWLGQISPWDDRVAAALDMEHFESIPAVGEPYRGWPVGESGRDLRTRLRYYGATLWPPEWWLRVRYGGRPGLRGRARSWARHAVELVAPLPANARSGAR